MAAPLCSFYTGVSETPPEFQAKLLTVVEHGVFRRVGGTKERRVRVRVIAASNQNLGDRVKAGAFRRDLLYRLNAFTVKIPPLRERGQDAVLIAEAMIERLAPRYGRPGRVLSEDARRSRRESASRRRRGTFPGARRAASSPDLSR